MGVKVVKTRGTNAWHGSGSVCSDVVYNKTRSGEEACGFRVAINEPHKPTIYIRVNLYGSNVLGCRKLGLGKGDYVIINGELMIRMGREEELLEVRGHKISILKDRKEG
jgi:single-stranded DNA-binding protein